MTQDQKVSGYFAAFKTDSTTGTDAVAPEWKSAEQKAGNYIGTKAAVLGENVLFAGDSGKLVLANAKTGEVKDKKDDITGKVRSPLVEANGSVWFATDEGVLYKVTLSDDGKVTEKATVSLPDKGNAVISILGGKVFVTGGSSQGYIAVYSESDATEILSQKTDHPVVSQAVTKSGENFYVYFTQEEDNANLYAAKLDADGKMTVETVYTSDTKISGELSSDWQRWKSILWKYRKWNHHLRGCPEGGKAGSEPPVIQSARSGTAGRTGRAGDTGFTTGESAIQTR